jgi:hypothetical protein
MGALAATRWKAAKGSTISTGAPEPTSYSAAAGGTSSTAAPETTRCSAAWAATSSTIGPNLLGYFIITRKAGYDAIVDFQGAEAGAVFDTIDLHYLAGRFEDFDDVVTRSHSEGDDLVIELERANTLTLIDTTIEELDAGNFIFG